jgi:hypothetical protein
VVEEPVEDGGGEGGVVVKDLWPVVKGAVGGNDQGTLLIAEADDLEQEVCSCLVNGEEAKLIQDEKGWLGVFFQFRFHTPGGLCGGKGVDDINSSGKQYGNSLKTCGIA